MSFAASKLILAAVVLAVATTSTGCGGNPTAKGLPASTAKRASTPVAKAPRTTPAKPATPATPASPAPVAPASNEVGTVMLMLSSLKADGVHGLAVQLTGPGLEEPIGKTLTAEELRTSNTLAFENIPVGALKATVAAFDKDEEMIGETATNVDVKVGKEAKVAIQMSAPAVAAGPVKVDFKFVEASTFDAKPTTASPAPTTETEEEEPPVPTTPTPKPSPTTNGKALTVEILEKASIRKFLIFKKLEVTVRVTNASTTETLDGEVKVEFHKVKGFLTKEDVIVQTLTAPISGLAPGKFTDVVITSTVSAEDAEATVHTIVASSSASTLE
jgi:hypothetical protein